MHLWWELCIYGTLDFSLISQLLVLHSYNKVLLYFLSFFSLSLSPSFFLTSWTHPESCVTCVPINGLQATEVTKATTVTMTDLWPREPRGISVRAFFISIYHPLFSQPCFISDLPTTYRERAKEAHMVGKGCRFRRPLERKCTWIITAAHKIWPFEHLPNSTHRHLICLPKPGHALVSKWPARHQMQPKSTTNMQPNWKMGKRPE